MYELHASFKLSIYIEVLFSAISVPISASCFLKIYLILQCLQNKRFINKTEHVIYRMLWMKRTYWRKVKLLWKLFTKMWKITSPFIMESQLSATITVESKVSRIISVTFVIHHLGKKLPWGNTSPLYIKVSRITPVICVINLIGKTVIFRGTSPLYTKV